MAYYASYAMARIGYKCDRCGDEHRGRDPAAFTDGMEMCAGCYDEYIEENGL